MTMSVKEWNLASWSVQLNGRTSMHWIERRKLISRLILCLATTGCFIQVTQVSVQYFSFTTTSGVAFRMVLSLQRHAVSLCIRYMDILDTDRLLQETGIHVLPVNNLSDALREESRLTIRQIFEYTPPADHLIGACTFRPNPWTMKPSRNRTTCNQRFEVSKFFMQEFVCYRVREDVTVGLRVHHVTRAVFSRQRVYTILLNDTLFAKIRMAVPIVFSQTGVDLLPYASRDHAPTLPLLSSRDGKRRMVKRFDFAMLIPSDVAVNLLPSPYDTHCRPFTQFTPKRIQCLIQGLHPMDRVPANEILKSPFPLKAVSTRDLKNRTLGPAIMSVYKACEKMFDIRICDDEFTVTQPIVSLDQFAPFGFALLTPTTPDLIITTQPTMLFVEYFCLICSCFGTWFGVSFLSIDSFNRRPGTNKKQRQLATTRVDVASGHKAARDPRRLVTR